MLQYIVMERRKRRILAKIIVMLFLNNIFQKIFQFCSKSVSVIHVHQSSFFNDKVSMEYGWCLCFQYITKQGSWNAKKSNIFTCKLKIKCFAYIQITIKSKNMKNWLFVVLRFLCKIMKKNVCSSRFSFINYKQIC